LAASSGDNFAEAFLKGPVQLFLRHAERNSRLQTKDEQTKCFTAEGLLVGRSAIRR
jgi:hypothetical protein